MGERERGWKKTKEREQREAREEIDNKRTD